MSVQEVLNSKECKDFLAALIREYDNRAGLISPGLELKRTPFDNLKDAGLMEPDKLIAEFTLVDQGISKLPRSQRIAVGQIVIEAAKRAHKILEPDQYRDEKPTYWRKPVNTPKTFIFNKK